MVLRGFLGIAFAVAMCLSVGKAYAQVESCIDSMSDVAVTEQLSNLERSFAHQTAGAAAWWSGWTAFNLFNVAYGSWKAVDGDTRLARDSWFVSVIGAAIFVAEVSVVPMPGLYAHRRFSRMPDNTAVERRIKLRRSWKLLERAAAVEKVNSEWVARSFALFYATGSSAYVWLRNLDASGEPLGVAVVLQFVTSIAVAELTFVTVPRRARRDRRVFGEAMCELSQGDLLRAGPRTAAIEPPPRFSLAFTLGPGQVGLSGRF